MAGTKIIGRFLLSPYYIIILYYRGTHHGRWNSKHYNYCTHSRSFNMHVRDDRISNNVPPISIVSVNYYFYNRNCWCGGNNDFIVIPVAFHSDIESLINHTTLEYQHSILQIDRVRFNYILSTILPLLLTHPLLRRFATSCVNKYTIINIRWAVLMIIYRVIIIRFLTIQNDRRHRGISVWVETFPCVVIIHEFTHIHII